MKELIRKILREQEESMDTHAEKVQDLNSADELGGFRNPIIDDRHWLPRDMREARKYDHIHESQLITEGFKCGSAGECTDSQACAYKRHNTLGCRRHECRLEGCCFDFKCVDGRRGNNGLYSDEVEMEAEPTGNGDVITVVKPNRRSNESQRSRRLTERELTRLIEKVVSSQTTVSSSINDIDGVMRQARNKGAFEGHSDMEVRNGISNVLDKLITVGDNRVSPGDNPPSSGHIFACGKKCGGNGKGLGGCFLGACIGVKGWPPDTIIITIPI